MASFSRMLENPLFLGACVAIVVLGCALLYYMTKSDDKPPQQSHEQQHQPLSETPPRNLSAKPALVLFYAKWCGASRQMLDEWNKAVEILKDLPELDVIEVSDEEHKATIQKAASELKDFIGFPDIRYFPYGIFGGGDVSYKGNRTQESFLKFAYTRGAQF